MRLLDINSIGPVLALVVTCLGVLLSVACLLFIFLGTKLPTQANQPNKITFKGVELQTTQAVMLLLVCVLVAALPLGGYLWLTNKAFQDAQLHLIATIEEQPGIFATEYDVSLVRVEAGKYQNQCPESKLENGEFSCISPLKGLRDAFELRIKKAGVQGRTITVKPTEQHVIVTLSGTR